MGDYSNGKIYKIIGDGLTYYGATILSLDETFQQHHSLHRNYVCSEEVLITGKAEIVLVENFPCNNYAELNARKYYYIENNECVNKKPKMSKEDKTKYNDNITKQFIIYIDEKYEQKRQDRLNKNLK